MSDIKIYGCSQCGKKAKFTSGPIYEQLPDDNYRIFGQWSLWNCNDCGYVVETKRFD